MVWTTKKLVLTGLYAGLLVGIEMIVALPLAIILGAGMGSIVGVFLGPLLLVLFKWMIKERGSLILVGLVASLLYLPLPAFGPPGFFPKLLILPGACLAMELVFLFLKKHPKITSICGSIAFNVVGLIIFIKLLLMFGIPSGERLVSLAIPFLIVSIFGGIIGGYCGYLIYKKIENKPFIKQIQS